MRTKKISIRNVTIYLVTAIVFFAFCFSRTFIVSGYFNRPAQLSIAELSSSTPHNFVDNSDVSLKIFHGLLCEEEESGEEREVEQTNSTSDLLATSIKFITEAPSKEVVYYYSDERSYNAPVGLYTLFCSLEI